MIALRKHKEPCFCGSLFISGKFKEEIIMKKFVKVVSLACASAMLLSTTAFADGDAFKVGGIGPVTGGCLRTGSKERYGACSK